MVYNLCTHFPKLYLKHLDNPLSIVAFSYLNKQQHLGTFSNSFYPSSIHTYALNAIDSTELSSPGKNVKRSYIQPSYCCAQFFKWRDRGGVYISKDQRLHARYLHTKRRAREDIGKVQESSSLQLQHLREMPLDSRLRMCTRVI